MTRRATAPRKFTEPLAVRTQNDVARILGITRAAVGWAEQSAFRKIIANFPGFGTVQKIRKCLRCGEEFESSGPGNRICPGCDTREDRNDRKQQDRRTAAARRRTENPAPEYTANAD